MHGTLTLLQRLFEAGHLIPTGVDGLYGRGAVFESVLDGLDRLITATGADQDAETMRFPPAVSELTLRESDYLKAFPHFAGIVSCFCGDERAHAQVLSCAAAGEDWGAHRRAAGIVLTPAACYPAYKVIARRGPLPTNGVTLDLASYCFRHEPSLEPTRQQFFRMREYVRMGTPEQVLDFRERWLKTGEAMMRRLGLPLEIDVANDPFFGRAGKVLASSQREQRLKFELLVPVNDNAPPTACLSFNIHLEHFGAIWNLRLADGSVAHTACVGFGMERIAIALLKHHGLNPAHWPADVRDTLDLA